MKITKSVGTKKLYHMRPCCQVCCRGRFLVLKEVAELADGQVGCGERARGGCLFAWNFSVTRLVYLRRRRDGLDQTRRCRCVSDSLLAYRLKIPLAKKTTHSTISRKYFTRVS